VRIAKTPGEFVAAVEAALANNRVPGAWLDAADRMLAQTSWDATWNDMADLIVKVWKPTFKKKVRTPLTATANAPRCRSFPACAGRRLDSVMALTI